MVLRGPASLMFRRAGVGVRLVAPGAEPITAGKGEGVVTVTGPPVELLLLASGRMRVAAVELEGSPEAVETLEERQARGLLRLRKRLGFPDVTGVAGNLSRLRPTLRGGGPLR